MCFKKISIILIILLLNSFIFAEGQAEGGLSKEDVKLLKWEKEAGLGSYRPEVDDWEAIEAAGKEEGSLVVYSNSSRVFAYCKSFYKKYKIKAEPNDIGTTSLIEKLLREQDAGVYNCDVAITGNAPLFVNDFVNTGRVYKFIPTEIKPKLNDDVKEDPIAIHHYGARAVLYDNSVYKEDPVNSWWDLTRPEWAGKVIMKDPLKAGAELNFIATFVKYADKVAEAYKEEFGEDLVLNGTKNAGYEFIKRLLDNQLILMTGGGSIVNAVSAKGSPNPPIGIASYSKLRAVTEGKTVAVVKDMKPTGGMYIKSVMGIPKYSSKPNAAKLMIQWCYGDENGKQGYKPYHVLGNWSSRVDVPEPKGQTPYAETGYWHEDMKWLYDNQVYVMDFWVQNM